MLSEHEQLADHEARISRQELPPLQQQLDNIEEIRQALSHEWQPFESAPDGVKLLWYMPFATTEYRYMVTNKYRLEATYWQPYRCKWQPLPPPPKEQK